MRTLLLAVFLIVGCGASQAPVERALPSHGAGPCAERREGATLGVLVLGDSIAAADSVAVDRRWSVQLGRALTDAFAVPTDVVNAAKGGSGVASLNAQAGAQQLEDFDIVFVISGVNDADDGSIAAWRSSYDAAITKLRRAGLGVIIGTPPPEYLDGAYTDRYLPVVEALRQIADGGLLLDLDRYWRDNVEPGAFHVDWIHPNEKAQGVIARLAAELVLECIGATPARPFARARPRARRRDPRADTGR